MIDGLQGLHVRLNLETGKREAKLVDPDEEIDAETENGMRSVVVDPESKGTTVTITTDLSGGVVAEDVTTTVASDEDASSSGLKVSEEESIDDKPRAESYDENAGDDETNWNHEKIYEVLQALPEPPKVAEMDIHEAHAKLSPAEFRLQMITLWKKRQVELKDAIDNIQDDSKYFAKLIEQFYEAEQKGDVDEQLAIMEVLEWEVQDLDKTLVFNFIGGFGVMAEHLNSTVLPIRAHAAWVVGSAAKNYYDAQNWVIDAGAVPKLISTLGMEVVGGSEDAQAIIEAKKKALYALSTIVRSNERGQRLFLLHNGPDVLAKLADEAYPVNLQQKVRWSVSREGNINISDACMWCLCSCCCSRTTCCSTASRRATRKRPRRPWSSCAWRSGRLSGALGSPLSSSSMYVLLHLCRLCRCLVV